jgi:hypothetical protein
MRRAASIALVAIVAGLIVAGPTDVSPSRRSACLERYCAPVAEICFAKETGPCAALGGCLALCGNGDVGCIENCQSLVDAACAQCMKGMMDCGEKHCPQEVAP